MAVGAENEWPPNHDTRNTVRYYGKKQVWYQTTRNHRSFSELTCCWARWHRILVWIQYFTIKSSSETITISWELTCVIIWSLVLNLFYWRRESLSLSSLSVSPERLELSFTIYSYDIFLSSIYICNRPRHSSWLSILVA